MSPSHGAPRGRGRCLCEGLPLYTVLAALALLSACVSSGGAVGTFGYGELTDSGRAISAIPLDHLSPRFRRQIVPYAGAYAPGTIVVDPSNYFLYLVRPGQRALRYGVGVGKGAFAWSGEARIGRRALWPRWTPPAAMIERAPNLRAYQAGLEPGALNPMGARALYLYRNGRDTLYRIHGTSEWWTIGKAASSGCIRMLNQDVIDLYARVEPGATVVVLPRRGLT